MEETRINKLKEKDDEFVKEANMIKLTTAVYGEFDWSVQYNYSVMFA